MHDVACQSSCLVREEILDLVKQTARNETVVDCVQGKVSLSHFNSVCDYEKNKDPTWPSSSLRLDVLAMAGVSVSE